MKTKFLLTALVLTFVTAQTWAIVDVPQSTDKEYMRNSGYSSTMVEMVQATKAHTNGQKYVTDDKIKHSKDCKFVKWVRRAFMYADPALEDGSFLDHDIKMTPQFSDL